MAAVLRGLELISLVMAIVCLQALAQPPPCAPVLVSLAPCLGFITGNSSTPPPGCCTQLATTVQSQAQCFCTFISTGAAQLGIRVNQTQAVTIPGACKIQAPPLSQCNAVAAGAPPAASPEASAPSGAPAAEAPSATTSSITPAPTASSTGSAPSDDSPSPSSTPATPGASSSPVTPTTTPSSSPSGGGSKMVPKAAQASAAGSSPKFSPTTFCTILVASYASSSFGF